MAYTVGQVIDLINQWQLPLGYRLEIVHEREEQVLTIKAIDAKGTTKCHAVLCVCPGHLADPDVVSLLLIGEQMFNDELRGLTPEPEIEPVKAAAYYETNRALSRKFGECYHRN